MNQFYRYNTYVVKDVQFLEAVSTSVNRGIVSICKICESLTRAHVSPITDTCSNYHEIRKHIMDAEQCLTTSEIMVKEKLGYLDECMCQLIREIDDIRNQKKEKSLTLVHLDIKKTSAVESLERSKEALEQAERSVESANYAIRAYQDQMNTYDDIATAGAAMLAIPILGWIAGPIMMHEGNWRFEEALNALKAAEWEKQSCESQVRNCNAKVSYYEGFISRTQNEIEQTNEALRRIEWNAEEVEKHLMCTADIQQMVRRAVHHLSVLSGTVTVLESQTQSSVQWQPMVKAMTYVMEAVVIITENRLLYSDGSLGFINTLRENVGNLLSLCNSPSNSDDDSHYI